MTDDVLPMTPDQIARYLSEHSDFFIDHEALLLSMKLPHTAAGAVSLVERQAAMLRERLQGLEHTLHALNDQARANESLARRMHRLALALIATDSPCEVVEAARTRLCTDFDLVAALIALEEGHPLTAPCIDAPRETAWTALFERDKPHIPRVQAELRELLLAHGLPETASVAAIPLRGEGFRGALLLVKREPQGFRPDMGTLFLEQIGDLLTTALARRDATAHAMPDPPDAAHAHRPPA
ncbi:MAG: DUF484 family protein [Pseudomonadota bacterium]